MNRVLPFIYYFGGKAGKAHRYPYPIYDTIIEPFAGGAGYSLYHYHKKVILYDNYHILAEVWKYLINAQPKDIIALPNRIENNVDDFPDLTEAEKWLIGFWLNGAESAPRKSPCNWAKQGKLVSWSPHIKRRIARQLKYISHWEMHEQSYESIPNQEATWFIDPPYYASGGKYKKNQNQIDYDHLAEWCKSRKGQVIVCERIHATWLPFKKFFVRKADRSKQKRYENYNPVSGEAIWINDHQGIRSFVT